MLQVVRVIDHDGPQLHRSRSLNTARPFDLCACAARRLTPETPPKQLTTKTRQREGTCLIFMVEDT
jgi:hypothetical protein